MRQPKAFTLVELLVVLAIISILLAVMSPTFRGTMLRGQATQCGKNQENILTAWTQYASNHRMIISSANTSNHGCVNGCPAPTHFTCEHDCSGPHSREWCHWRDAWVANGHYGNSLRSIENGVLYQYLGNASTYRCPTPVYNYYSSYSFNGLLRGEGGAGQGSVEDFRSIRDPSNCMAMIEDDDFRGYNMNSWMLGGINTWIDYVGGNHGDGDNLGFCDGHVEFWQWKDPDTLSFPYPPGSTNPDDRKFGISDPGSVDIQRVYKVFWPL